MHQTPNYPSGPKSRWEEMFENFIFLVVVPIMTVVGVIAYGSLILRAIMQ